MTNEFRADLTLSRAIPAYLAAQKNRRLSPGTLETYTFILDRFRAHFAPADPIPEAIQPHDIDLFLSRFGGLSAKRLLNYYVALSALWTWLHRRGYVSRHVVRDVDPPRPSEKAIEAYTAAEVERLIDATWESPRNGPMLRALIYTLAGTGLRCPEACALNIADIAGTQIMVRKGKGGKPRSVYLPAKALDALKVYHSTRRDLEPDRPVFTNAHGKRLIRKRAYKAIRQAGERADIPGATVHKFRHYFAISFLKNGGNLRTLQLLMGHSDIRTTARYANYSNDDIKWAALQFAPGGRP